MDLNDELKGRAEKKIKDKMLKYFDKILNLRRKHQKGNIWLCKEGYGQAFLVWGYKK